MLVYCIKTIYSEMCINILKNNHVDLCAGVLHLPKHLPTTKTKSQSFLNNYGHMLKLCKPVRASHKTIVYKLYFDFGLKIILVIRIILLCVMEFVLIKKS